MDLPPEIRNQIYKFLIPVKASNEYGLTLGEPSLFRCSKKIREESHLMFYQRCDFRYHCNQNLKLCLLPRWLDRIGPIACKNVLNLEIEGRFDRCDIPIINLIHLRLSEEATVTYKRDAWYPSSGSDLDMIKTTYERKMPGRVLVLDTDRPPWKKMVFPPGNSWFGPKRMSLKLTNNSADVGPQAGRQVKG